MVKDKDGRKDNAGAEHEANSNFLKDKDKFEPWDSNSSRSQLSQEAKRKVKGYRTKKEKKFVRKFKDEKTLVNSLHKQEGNKGKKNVH